MARLPSRYAPFAFSVLQVTLTTGVATAVGVHQSQAFGAQWAMAWAVAWLTMMPVVVFAARRSFSAALKPSPRRPDSRNELTG